MSNPHPPRLHNKVALVTGASSGIGRAISLAYASHGTRLVVCADLTPGPSGELQTHDFINKEHGAGKAIFVTCNVADSESFKAAVEKAVEEGGRLDILVNNAGVGEHNYPRLHLMPDAVWDSTMAVNARGVFLGCKYALAQFMAQPPHPSGDRGWLINIASIFGINGYPGGHGPYCASKAAVLNLTKSIALDYAADKIHCNAICPGFTESGMTASTLADKDANAERVRATPWGRWGKASEMADAAVWLASAESSFVTGVGLPVDGGYLAM